jgi:hypothetical protein
MFEETIDWSAWGFLPHIHSLGCPVRNDFQKAKSMTQNSCKLERYKASKQKVGV